MSSWESQNTLNPANVSTTQTEPTEQVLSRKEDVQYMHLFTKSAFGMVLLIVTKCAKSGANIPVKVGEMDGRSYEGEQELLFWNYFMCKI